MCLHLSVSHFVHRGSVWQTSFRQTPPRQTPPLGDTPQADTPLGRHPPGRQPPRQAPLWADTLLGRHPQAETPHLGRHTPWQTPLKADTPLTGRHHLRDGNWSGWAVRNLLECILIVKWKHLCSYFHFPMILKWFVNLHNQNKNAFQ